VRIRRKTVFLISGAAALAAVGLAAAQPAGDAVVPPPQEPAAAPAAPAPLPSNAPAAAAPGSDAEPLEDLAPSSGAAAKATAPPRRALYTAAVIEVLDKVTAESLRFEAPLHKFIRYKGLIFLVNTCQGGTPDQPEPAAHLEIDSQPPTAPGRPPNPVKLVYRGWMFADAPGPHPFEHPVYDAWLIACRTASGGA
jgi:hypothetical protein